MASEEKTKHTIDNDVTFERMKNAQKKASFYSTHRQLSWQCNREVKQFEKDRNLATFGIDREKTSMLDRLVKLQEAQKEIQGRRHSEPSRRMGRRSSEPCISVEGLKDFKSSELVKKSEQPTPTSRLTARRNTVADGLGDKALLPLLKRLSTANIEDRSGRRKGSLDEKIGVIAE